MPAFHPLVRRDVVRAIRHYDSINDTLGHRRSSRKPVAESTNTLSDFTTMPLDGGV